jgi:hypothetical protein
MAHWRPDWTQGNGFSGHLGWHQALFALESLDHARALQLFDEHLRADPAQITLQRLDAAALLWRLHLQGVDVGPRWDELLRGWNPQPQHAGHSAFNDLHALLAMIGAQDLPRAHTWLQSVVRSAEAASGVDRDMARHVGLPLMRGLLAFAEGRPGEAIATIYPVRGELHRFGGSHAQRDLVTQTLLAAAAHAHDAAVGRALLNERRLGKPVTPLTRLWQGRFGPTR